MKTLPEHHVVRLVLCFGYSNTEPKYNKSFSPAAIHRIYMIRKTTISAECESENLMRQIYFKCSTFFFVLVFCFFLGASSATVNCCVSVEFITIWSKNIDNTWFFVPLISEKQKLKHTQIQPNDIA